MTLSGRVGHVVGFVDPLGTTGGVYPVAREQTRLLREEGVNVQLASFQSRSDARKGADEIRFKVLRPILPGAIGALRLRLPSERPAKLRTWLSQFDVLHIHLSRDLLSSLMLVYAKRLRVATVVQPHGTLSARISVFHRIFDLFTRRARLRVELVLYLHEDEVAPLTALFPRARLERVVNTFARPEDASSRSEAVERKGFVYSGRFSSNKRVELVVAACEQAHVNIDIYGVSAAELGRPGEPATLASAIRAHGMIDRVQVLDRYSTAEGLMLLSVNDPFPMAVVEALGYGCPVMICESNGLASLVKQYNAGIVLADNCEVADVVVAISEFMSQERAETFSRGAKDLSRNELDGTRAAEKLISLYRTALISTD